MKKVLRRILKVIGWTVFSIIMLLILVIVLIQVPGVQNFARKKAVAFLEKKIGTRVEIGHLSIEFPKKIVLQDVFFEDQKHDTLLAGQELKVDISMFRLLKKEVEINDVELKGIRAHIYRIAPDTVFNYDYIVKAFVGEQKKPEPKDTAASTMKFNVKHVQLDDILATYRDDSTGNDVYGYLGHFETHIKKFDLDKMAFEVPDITLKNIVARVYQHKPLADPIPAAQVVANSKQPVNTILKLGTININTVAIDFKNDVSAFSTKLALSEFSTEVESMDLQKLDVRLKQVTLNGMNAEIAMGKTVQSAIVADQVAQTAAAQAGNPWNVIVGKISLNNDNLKFDNDNEPKLAHGMDYAHLDVHNLNMDAGNLALTPTTDAGVIRQLSFTEKSGFNLKTLHTDFLYNEHGAYLKDLLVQTDKTELKRSIALSWPSIDMLATNIGELGIDANLSNCTIAFKDMLLFAPQMAAMPQFKNNQNAVLKLNTQMKGYVKDLTIENLEMSTLQSTAVKMSGRIKGLPDANKTIYDINLPLFRTSRADIQRLAPPGSLPPTVRIPETIAANGVFAGSLNAFNTRMNVNTSRGSATVAGMVRGMGQSYNLTATANNLDVGYITMQEKTVGKVSLAVTANGSGFDPKTMVATVKGRVIAAQAMQYNYRNLSVDAKLNRGNIVAKADMHDPNLSFNLDAQAVMKGNFPAVKANLMLDSINLQALHFNQQDLRLHGRITADMPSTNPDALEGNVQVTDLLVAANGKRFKVDTISMVAGPSPEGRRIALNSQALTAELNGQYKLTELGSAIQETINKYYHLPGYVPQAYSPQMWAMNAKVMPSPMLYAFVPELQGSDSINAQINFNSAANDLNLLVSAPKIKYSDNVIDSLTLKANTGTSLDYSVSLNDAGSAAFKVYHTLLNGSVANNQLTANVDVKDVKNTSQYQLGATMMQTPDNGFRASLAPNLMLDYDKWAVGDNNYLQYNTSGVIVNNLTLSNGGQSLSVNSQSPTTTAPIDVRFSNFRIATITHIANQDSVLADGLINGTAQVTTPTTNPIFTSDITVQDLSYKRDTIGNLAIKVDNQRKDALNANVTLDGHGNQLAVTGLYYIADQRLDMNLNIANINLAAAKPFSAGQLTDAGGSLKGNVAIKGSVTQPAVNGALHFDQAFLTPTLLGERFTLPNDDIAINQQGIHFNQFTIQDSTNNKAVIDGDILTSDFKNYRFAVKFDADNFTAVNTKKAIPINSVKQPFYGQLNLSTHVKVTGDMLQPSVNGSLRVNKGTDFTYIMPTLDPEVQSRQGVVEFVDKVHPQDSAVFAHIEDSIANHPTMSAIDLAAVVETDSAAQFNLVIDERNGDAVRLRGTANLSTGIDKSGKISLTGTYTLQEGSYLLTLNFLKRQFNVVPGSTLTWTGDPLTATVDITARYIANTGPIDLMQDQLTGSDLEEQNRYKQKLPFNVDLRMSGELMKPTITFGISLPERYQTQWPLVETKLEQVSRDDNELNKQVFALLLLNRFVQENPLESAGGGGNVAESFVRQSASRILTDQLNRLAGSLIKGVDLNFGVNSGDDYSSGQLTQRTDLTVGVSKRLLSDRLRVNVGSSFEVEGPRENNQDASNIGGDISVDYQLSKDGRYQIRAYRRNEYDGLAEGQVTESGLTFLFSIDYDKFNEFFHKHKSTKK